MPNNHITVEKLQLKPALLKIFKGVTAANYPENVKRAASSKTGTSDKLATKFSCSFPTASTHF